MESSAPVVLSWPTAPAGMGTEPLRRPPTGGMVAVARDMIREPDAGQMARHMAELYSRPGSPRQTIRDLLTGRDPKLLAFLWKPSTPNERLEILGRIEGLDPDFALRLVDRLHLDHDVDARVRARAVRILAGSDQPQHREALTARLGDSDPRVRANAVEGLAPALDAHQTTRLFEPLTRDPQPRPKANALLALIRRGCMRAREELAAMLASPAVGAKASARWALNQLLKGI